MKLAWRNTIGDVLRRSAARSPGVTALHFEDRVWSYRELDAAANRVARRLLGAGPARRAIGSAAYGKNSDAYLLLFLACARAGLVHVPHQLRPVGRGARRTSCGSPASRALFFDPALGDKVAADPGARCPPPSTGRCAAARTATSWPGPARARTAASPEVDLDDGDLVQLLYTSGTTAAPRGAMLTHRALVQEYLNCIIALDFRATDRPLHVLPLYHSAQLHVFLMPYLALGATNWLVEAAMPRTVLRADRAVPHRQLLRAAHRLDRAPAPAGLRRRAICRALRKAYYGASIMPVPVLQSLRERLPALGFYNCFGQSEIAPLATVLRPEEHDAAARLGRPADPLGRDAGGRRRPARRRARRGRVRWSTDHRSSASATGTSPRRRRRRSRAAGSTPETWPGSTSERFIYVVDRKKDIIKPGGIVVASREVEEALYTHPAVKEVAVIGTPHPTRIETVTAVVVLKEARQVAAEELIRHARERLASFKVPRVDHFVEDLAEERLGQAPQAAAPRAVPGRGGGAGGGGVRRRAARAGPPCRLHRPSRVKGKQPEPAPAPPTPARSDGADVRRLQALGALDDVELDLLALREAAEAVGLDGRVVAEHVLAAAILRDEAEALRVVEPLHRSSCHSRALSTCGRLDCRSGPSRSGSERQYASMPPRTLVPESPMSRPGRPAGTPVAMRRRS